MFLDNTTKEQVNFTVGLLLLCFGLIFTISDFSVLGNLLADLGLFTLGLSCGYAGCRHDGHKE